MKHKVKTLRSGKYKQTTGVLVVRKGESCDFQKPKNFDRFCCLGVLCDITGSPYKSKQQFPGRKMLKDLGLSKKEASTLADMNDSRDSFKRIATYIERM